LFNCLKLNGYLKITNFLTIKLTFKKLFLLLWVVFTLLTCSFLRNMLIGYISGLSNYFVFFLFSFYDLLTFIKTLIINSGYCNWLNSRSLEYVLYIMLIHFNIFFKNLFLLNYSYIITFYLNIFLNYKIFFVDTFFHYTTWVLYYLDNLYAYFSSNSTRCNSKYYIIFIFTFFIFLFLFVEFKKISILLNSRFIKNRYFSRKVNFFNNKYMYFFKKK